MLMEVPKLHEDIATVGFKNFYKLKNIYSEILGLKNVEHLSINIESPDGKLIFLSCNPGVALTLIKKGLLLYDGTVSPTVYRKKSIYVWDRTYNPRYAEEIKKNKEYKFGISKGVVLVTKVNGFHIMYSFAAKKNGNELIEDILEAKTEYLKMGDHCYQLIRPVYANYLLDYDVPNISPPLIKDSRDGI